MISGSLCRVLLHCLVAVLAGTGCSVLYDAAAQCNRDSDCAKRANVDPLLLHSYCDNHVCVLPQEQANACETHADCLTIGNSDPAICRNHACISLLHGECRQVLNSDALKDNSDVILLGAFAPLNDNLPAQDTVLMSYQLALDEITANTKGAIGYLDYRDRPFVLVVCRSDGASLVSDSFDHLTKTLKVPVVVTNQQGSALEAQVTRLIAQETNSMFLSPLSSDPSLAALKDMGRLWHMLGSPTDLVPGYLALIRAQIAAVAPAEARVLTVVNDVVAMGAIADAVEARLLVNGLPVAQAIEAQTYRRVAVESSAIHPVNPNTSQLLPAIQALKPNVIVMLAGPEVVDSGIVPTENSIGIWGSTQAPLYVLSHHLFNNNKLRDALKPLPETANRIYGIGYAGAEDRSLYQGYLLRLSAKYPEAFREEYENFYDAAHYAMLSVIGVAREVPTDSLTGDLAVKGFRRLIDKNGAPYDLKPEALSTIATGILEANGESTVYLTGTLGQPDFNAAGARYTTAALWCVTVENGTPTYHAGAVRFDTASGAFDNPLEKCRGYSN